jgi:hypothetical protein
MCSVPMHSVYMYVYVYVYVYMYMYVYVYVYVCVYCYVLVVCCGMVEINHSYSMSCSAMMKKYTLEQWSEWMIYTMVYKTMVIEQVSVKVLSLTNRSLARSLTHSLTHSPTHPLTHSVPCTTHH